MTIVSRIRFSSSDSARIDERFQKDGDGIAAPCLDGRVHHAPHVCTDNRLLALELCGRDGAQDSLDAERAVGHRVAVNKHAGGGAPATPVHLPEIQLTLVKEHRHAADEHGIDNPGHSEIYAMCRSANVQHMCSICA
eukprot:2134650-Pleurochrysis_carterae.AAC.1